MIKRKTVLMLTVVIRVMLGSVTVHAEFTTTDFDSLSISANTGEKPQSKVWTYDGQWWCVLPTDSAAGSDGTWIWKLQGTTWVGVLKLSDETGTKADVKKVGNVVHVLLYDDDSELVSVEYSGGTYQLWSLRPSPSPVASLESSETASIDIDSEGRMWLAMESEEKIRVYYSDSPYDDWSDDIELASGVYRDDICVVTAMPDDTIGVLWSDQNRKRFGFRVHADGANPSTWSANEVPASLSARNVGGGMADDHLNVAVASDGTLYAAVKTSYDTIGYPKIALLVRRPGGTWDGLYEVDAAVGTRGIALLNEAGDTITIVYTHTGSFNGIVCKQSPTSAISFGSYQYLISGPTNNATSMKENYAGEVVILASSDDAAESVLATGDSYIITGCINNSCEVPIEGVLVDANNGGGQNITNTNGFYGIWVNHNWSGTVTPSKIHYTFDPNSKTYTNVIDDWAGQDYDANCIYDLDCSSSIGFGDVRIIGENWLDGPNIPGDFYKDDDDIINFLDFADFANVWGD